MKRGAKLAALAAALAVLVGAWLLAQSMTRQRQEDLAQHADEEGIDLAVGRQEDIIALAWNYFGDAVSLRYDAGEGLWINDQDPDCPIDQEAVGPLLEAAASLTASGAVEDVTDFGQYGLDDPAFAVMAGTAEKVVTYYIGSSAPTGQWYVRLDGEDRVYLEDGTLAEKFQLGLEDVLALDSAPQDIAAVTSLRAETDAGSYALEYVADPGSVWYTDTWPWFLTDGEGRPARPLDTDKVKDLYGLATGIVLDRCVTWSAGTGAEYGLDRPQGTVRVGYDDTQGKSGFFTLQFGDYKDGDVYVRPAGSEMVYLVSGTVLDGLMYPDFDAMAPLAPTALNFDRLQSVFMELDTDSYSIRRSLSTPMDEGEEPEEIFTTGDRSLDAERVSNWLRQVYELPADSRADQAQGREIKYRFTFRQTSDLFPEVTAEFRAYDSAHYLCTVNGEESYLVPRTSADSMASNGAALILEKTVTADAPAG